MGLLLARRVGTEASRTLLGPDQFDRLTAALRRRGLALLAVCRPVPVLAEASVLVAGASRMPLRRTIGVTAAANVGVAGVYVWLGASAGDAVPFLLVFAASCLLPAASWALARSLRLVTASGR